MNGTGFSSFGICKMVIEEANKRFAPLFAPDTERIDILKEYCGVIDEMLAEFGGETFEAEIDETDMTVRLSMTLNSVEVCDTKNARIQQLLRRALRFSVSHADDDHILLSLIFPSLWVKSA